MGNTFGNNIKITLFGESHGSKIGAVIDNIPAGIVINRDYIDHQLELRRPQDKISTSRKESDCYEFVSGVFNGRTTGSPLCVLIDNKDIDSSKYEEQKDLMRPGHADYTAHIKYDGFEDYRGGGHFSGRLTAPLVICGSIFKELLETKGIKIGTHISRSLNVVDSNFNADIERQIGELNNKLMPCINDLVGEEIKKEIARASCREDSIGAVLETAIVNLPAGLGSPWFDSVESQLSSSIFSIPAIKGIEFGSGFKMVNCYGSEINDSFYYENGKVKTKTNNNGGINGGITNGQPVIFRTIVKPTPSIAKEQETINIKTKTNEVIKIVGRHDPAIFPRARVVIDSMAAIVIADLLIGEYGLRYFKESN